jgi:hypothetical protein
MFLHHELQGLSGASGIPRHHGITGHHLANWGGVGIHTLGRDLVAYVRLLK